MGDGRSGGLKMILTASTVDRVLLFSVLPVAVGKLRLLDCCRIRVLPMIRVRYPFSASGPDSLFSLRKASFVNKNMRKQIFPS